jgi:hypothetical protein
VITIEDDAPAAPRLPTPQGRIVDMNYERVLREIRRLDGFFNPTASEIVRAAAAADLEDLRGTEPEDLQGQDAGSLPDTEILWLTSHGS